MSLSLSASDLAAKPFIKKALLYPNSPASVLSFFFGVDYSSPSDDYKTIMREGTPLRDMNDLWYGGGDEYDKLCEMFVPVIRSVVADPNALKERSPDQYQLWNGSVDGLMSQVLLCDQLSRNAFRGKEEAFQYDDVGEKNVLQLVQEFFKGDLEKQSVPGEFYPPYVSFLITALMHSEKIENHKIASQILQESQKKYHDQETVINTLEMQAPFLEAHTAVIHRFGRYPHRNSKLGRDTNTEEQAWLNDTENLPQWAKSQG